MILHAANSGQYSEISPLVDSNPFTLVFATLGDSTYRRAKITFHPHDSTSSSNPTHNNSGMDRRTGTQLLQASAEEDTISEFRMLINGSVRYIAIDPGIYEISDMCFGPTLIPLLPPFPSGDWKSAQVRIDPVTGQPYFEAVSNHAGPSIRWLWHRTTVD